MRIPGFQSALWSCLQTKHLCLVFLLINIIKIVLKFRLQSLQIKPELAKAAFKIWKFIEYQVLNNVEPIGLCCLDFFNFRKPDLYQSNSLLQSMLILQFLAAEGNLTAVF